MRWSLGFLRRDKRLLARRKAFTILKWGMVLIDAVLVSMSFLFAFWLRVYSGLIPIGDDVSLGINHFTTLIVITGIFLYIFRAHGLYRGLLFRPGVSESFLIVKSVILGMLLLLAYTLISKSEYFMERRSIVVIAGATLCISEAGVRCVLLRALLRSGYWRKNTVVVGTGPGARLLAQRLLASKRSGFEVKGFIDEFAGERASPTVDGLRVLGGIEQLPQLSREHDVEEAFLALASNGYDKMLKVISLCKQSRLRVRVLSKLFDVIADRVDAETVSDVPIITIRESRLRGVNEVSKRAADIVVAAIVLLVLFPVMLAIALAVVFTSRGPALFSQERLGERGKKFRLLKFRSMYVGDHQERHREYAKKVIRGEDANFTDSRGRKVNKIVDDDRVTPLGRFLRKNSLDELPQLLNVLKGDMSLVGPRPPIPYEVEFYDEWHKKRFEVKPGMTGLWQVSGRTETDFREMVLLDIYYCENWSLWLDLKILLRTVPSVILGRGAY